LGGRFRGSAAVQVRKASRTSKCQETVRRKLQLVWRRVVSSVGEELSFQIDTIAVLYLKSSRVGRELRAAGSRQCCNYRDVMAEDLS
jgi:hypothetical protein